MSHFFWRHAAVALRWWEKNTFLMNREGPLCAGAEWARFKGHVYRDLCRSFIISQCCTFAILSHHLLFAHLLVSFCAYSHINRAPRVRPRSHLKGEATGVYAIGPLHVCRDLAFSFKKKTRGGQALGVKKKRDGAEGRRRGGGAAGRQKYASVLRASKVSRACLLPDVGRGGEGGGFWPVREWGGWLNDFTSPFQLQQLPIYIVMQIHGLSQMVLFQHRGCIEIWLFIPSTSKVFNAPSSVCFYPFLPWQPFKICAALMCLSPQR